MMEIRKELKDNVLTVFVAGMLNTQTAPELQKELDGSVSAETELVLDFEKLEYISSAGLRVLIATQKKLGNRSRLRIVNMSPAVKEIFNITGLSSVFAL